MTSGPRCFSCQGVIRPGMEMAKRVEFWQQPDTTVKVFGENMPDGPLSAATGTLVRIQHQKEYWAQTKRGRRGGDAVQGTRPGLVDIYADDEDE